ncbi:hypothetical protein ACIBU0_03145 [Streptomyces sp. NPDC049627]|uniref:hypothetical protein n=1 Tax=Streptomyces sp. NPDC049627 TaxID=3365595 RepID=UPI00379A8363
MLSEELLALASAGGGAVVAAAGTDAWNGLRQAVARWFGRGDAETEGRELERLDETAAALLVSEPTDAERARIRHEAAWQTLFTMALENLQAAERDRAAEELRSLLAGHAPRDSAGPGGLVVGGDATFRADGASVTAGVINGGVRMGTPSQPDPSQG